MWQVFGAFWYLFSIERKTVCWKQACSKRGLCKISSLYCPKNTTSGNITSLNEACPVLEPNTTRFDFGIFLGALDSGVVESHDFPQKFFYCFWWGLQNLRYYIIKQQLFQKKNTTIKCSFIFFLVCFLIQFARSKP